MRPAATTTMTAILLITTNNGPARLLRNDGGIALLADDSTGSKSNRNGFGAQVKITAGESSRETRSAAAPATSPPATLRLVLGWAGPVKRTKWKSIGQAASLTDCKT